MGDAEAESSDPVAATELPVDTALADATCAGRAPCDDGNKCTIDDHCESGVCRGTDVTCSPRDACHVAGTCLLETGECTDVVGNNGATCSDDDACTLDDKCESGTCHGFPKPCPASNDCVLDGVCNPAFGGCEYPKKPNGAYCDTGNLCTKPGQCRGGLCEGGAPLENGARCSDTVPCTYGEMCVDSMCGGGASPHDEDGNWTLVMPSPTVRPGVRIASLALRDDGTTIAILWGYGPGHVVGKHPDGSDEVIGSSAAFAVQVTYGQAGEVLGLVQIAEATGTLRIGRGAFAGPDRIAISGVFTGTLTLRHQVSGSTAVLEGPPVDSEVSRAFVAQIPSDPASPIAVASLAPAMKFRFQSDGPALAACPDGSLAWFGIIDDFDATGIAVEDRSATPVSLEPLTFGADTSFVAGFSPSGDVRWVQQLRVSTSEGYSADVSDVACLHNGTVVAVGRHSGGVTVDARAGADAGQSVVLPELFAGAPSHVLFWDLQTGHLVDAYIVAGSQARLLRVREIDRRVVVVAQSSGPGLAFYQLDPLSGAVRILTSVATPGTPAIVSFEFWRDHGPGATWAVAVTRGAAASTELEIDGPPITISAAGTAYQVMGSGVTHDLGGDSFFALRLGPSGAVDWAHRVLDNPGSWPSMRLSVNPFAGTVMGGTANLPTSIEGRRIDVGSTGLTDVDGIVRFDSEGGLSCEAHTP